MKRKLYNYATLASMLLLCASLWWWNHSSRNTDQVTLHGGATAMQVTGSGGQVMLTKVHRSSKNGGQLSWSSAAQSGSPKLLATSFRFNSHPHNGMTLILPSWALALIFAVLPSLWVWSKVKRKGGKKKPEGAH